MINAPLYVISAGLGLIDGDCCVPAYGLTIAGRGPESVSSRVLGRFNTASWWLAIKATPFSTPLADIFARGTGLILIAVTRPYAQLLVPDLDNQPDTVVARLRITGVKLQNLLPERLSASLLPYDERLDSILPGTRADFAHRALAHFVTKGLSALPDADSAGHRDWVHAALSRGHAPLRPRRPRLSDEEIVSIIERHLPQTKGVGRLLRVLRDQEGIACEQARFTRLYRATIERNTAI